MFALGVPDPTSRRERNRSIRRKQRLKTVVSTTPKPPFLLSPFKKYDFAVQFTLNSFPQKGYQALTELHKLLAPPCEGHPKLYLWSPAQAKALTDAVHETIRCRWIFRRFYLIYLQNKMKVMNNKSDEGTLDPITMEPISWPVWIIDIKNKAKYEFEQRIWIRGTESRVLWKGWERASKLKISADEDVVDLFSKHKDTWATQIQTWNLAPVKKVLVPLVS